MDMGVSEMMMAATVASTAGAVASGVSQYQASQYQAQVALNNQKIANDNAQMAIDQGNIQAAAKQQQTAQTAGAINAQMEASGIDTGSGTANRLQSDTAALGTTDLNTILNNAKNTAIGYQNQGLNFAAQAQLDKNAATSALYGGALNAFGSFASGSAKTLQSLQSSGKTWSDLFSSGSGPSNYQTTS
jgi:hypothetical protein